MQSTLHLSLLPVCLNVFKLCLMPFSSEHYSIATYTLAMGLLNLPTRLSEHAQYTAEVAIAQHHSTTHLCM